MNPLRNRGPSVTAGYTLLLVFTTVLPAAGADVRASVQGTVTNAVTGEPLRKAYLRLAPASEPTAVLRTTTDSQGKFTLKDIPPGNYSLEAEHQGFIDARYGPELKLLAGQDFRNLNIRLMPPASISGRITDEDGDPWTHAVVNVFRSKWQGGKQQLTGFTSADPGETGVFRIKQLPPGRYYLLAEPDAHWEQMNRPPGTPQLQPTWYPGSPLVLLPGQELTAVEIRLRRSSVYRITGKVSGVHNLPVLPGPGPWMKPRLSVSAASDEGGNSKSATMREDGSFLVDGLPPGNYRIRIEQGIWPAMTLGSATVQISDHDVEGVSLTATPPHALKGVIRIEGEDGNDAALPQGLTLTLGSSDAAPLADGSFVFDNVPPGDYRVHLRATTPGRYYLKQLALSITDPSSPIELTLSPHGALVNGVIARHELADPALTQVVLLPEATFDDSHLGVLDQSGAFTIKDALRPGAYILYAFEGVPEGAWTDPAFIKEIAGKGVRIDLAEGDVRTVEVPLIPQSDIGPLLIRLGMN